MVSISDYKKAYVLAKLLKNPSKEELMMYRRTEITHILGEDCIELIQ